MSISYKWAVINTNTMNRNYFDTLNQAVAYARPQFDAGLHTMEIQLVRLTGNNQQTALFVQGILPESFSGGAKIPSRFREEIRNARHRYIDEELRRVRAEADEIIAEARRQGKI